MKGKVKKLEADRGIREDMETALVILASENPAIWRSEVSWSRQIRKWSKSLYESYPMIDAMERKARINLILNFVKEELAVKKRR